jgi:hypothetical protein
MAHWKQGQSGNPKGRPAGSKNRSTAEIKDLLAEVVPFEELVVKPWKLTKRGNVRAAELLLAYRYGRPTASLEVEAVDTGDILERARQSLAGLGADLSDSLLVDRDGVTGKDLQE